MTRANFESLVMTLCGIAFLFGFLALAVAHGQTRTINLTPSNVSVTGANVVFNSDGGCMLQPACTTTISDVHCDASPQAFNRGGACAAFRVAAVRAAMIDVGVSDGGLP